MLNHTAFQRIRPLQTLLTAIISLLLCFSAPAFAEEDGVLDDVLENGKLRVGLSSFVPWAMRNTDGDFIGFEVDVIKQLAEDMGVEAEIIPTAWDGLIPALLAGKIDLIIAGMSITPARNLQVNFTDAYARSGLSMVANKELTAGMNDINSYNKEEVVFALRRGASPVVYVRENLPKATIKQFDDDATIRQELLNGNAHAWVVSVPEPHFSALRFPEKLHVPIDGLFQSSQEGMALRKGDGDALNFLNNWIAGKWNSGWLQERHDYWFKNRAWASQVKE